MSDPVIDRLAGRLSDRLPSAPVERMKDYALKITLPGGRVEVYHYDLGYELQANYFPTTGERIEFIDAAAEAGIRTQFQYNRKSLDAVIDQFVRTCEHLAARAA